MNIFVNEKLIEVEDGTTLFNVKDMVKKDADVLIYNGFLTKNDFVLMENDKIVLIKKGEKPSEEEMEVLLMARHTPNVHEKLKKCFVGIAGLGGLGSNVALSLARIGIGKLLLVDYDVVEPSNLNRQQYFIRHLGMKKTDAMEQIIKECNPFAVVEKKAIFLDETNIETTFKDVDIIVEAFDNPVSKAVLTNTVLCKMKNKKIVAASGMAGHFSGNIIVTKKINDRLYLIGDGENEAKPGCGLMAPRVAIAANHQANTVLRIILGEE